MPARRVGQHQIKATSSGPYAAALAAELARPGLDHLNLFQNVKEAVLSSTGGTQQPWESNGLGRRVYLTGRPIPAATAQPKLSEAERTWPWIKETTNQSVLENFIKQFGDTEYGAKARARLEEVRKQQVAGATPPAAVTEPAKEPAAAGLIGQTLGILFPQSKPAQQAEAEKDEAGAKADAHRHLAMLQQQEDQKMRILALSASPRLPVDTPTLIGSIDLKGGQIDDLVLTKYWEMDDHNRPNIMLFIPSRIANARYASFGWLASADANQETPNENTIWRQENATRLTPSEPVRLTWDNGQGLIFTRSIAVDDGYFFSILDEVENRTNRKIAFYPYSLISRHGIEQEKGDQPLHNRLVGIFGGAGLQDLGYQKALKEGGSKSFKQIGGWAGLSEEGWAAVLVPDQATPYEAKLASGKSDAQTYLQVEYVMNPVSIPAGEKGSADWRLFAGPKQAQFIKSYQDTLGIKNLEALLN